MEDDQLAKAYDLGAELGDERVMEHWWLDVGNVVELAAVRAGAEDRVAAFHRLGLLARLLCARRVAECHSADEGIEHPAVLIARVAAAVVVQLLVQLARPPRVVWRVQRAVLVSLASIFPEVKASTEEGPHIGAR